MFACEEIGEGGGGVVCAKHGIVQSKNIRLTTGLDRRGAVDRELKKCKGVNANLLGAAQVNKLERSIEVPHRDWDY